MNTKEGEFNGEAKRAIRFVIVAGMSKPIRYEEAKRLALNTPGPLGSTPPYMVAAMNPVMAIIPATSDDTDTSRATVLVVVQKTTLSIDPGSGMGDMIGMESETPALQLKLLSEEENFAPAYANGQPAAALTLQERETIAHLIELDVWIANSIGTIRNVADDAMKYKKAQEDLKSLLQDDYDTQLKKQQADIDRMAEKLKKLQEEVAKRTAARDRVIDIQMGKVLLEAEGLLKNDR